ncbi:LOW QUALITY PROTEIN: phospholipid-transporting ATPase ABCA3 [Drosophila eugracilis]|uniref:LOW QUALITY PROTEIN: phospholipid-transporting ATPase ABCA3 n=1 Tax=Drosophila eugracilis TaxID=29029 RepID=UPI001BD9DF56|nr:LOW QUALITY PROTEIN: phospholipid-transporting ATPase ABCA3 [Drosophila eugracilis]
MSRNLTCCQKYRLLLWKDLKLQFGNVAEFLMIILFAALMPIIFTLGTMLAKSMFPKEKEMEKVYGPRSVTTRVFEELYYFPYNGLLDQLIAQLANVSDIYIFESYDTRTELFLNLKRDKSALGIAFPYDWYSITTMPEHINFTLYMPLSIKSSSFNYFESGFLLMQERLSQIFIGFKDSRHKNMSTLRMKHFPYPRYTPNPYSESAKYMTYMTLLSFLLPCMTTVKYIVDEKENQQKAILKTMGFKNWIHWLAWYTKSMFIMLLCVAIVIFIYSTGTVYEFSNLVCLVVIFLVYIHSLVFFIFLVSSFCFDSFWAVVYVFLLYVATTIPFAVVGTDNSSIACQIAACFGLNSALFYILDSVATMEMQSVGVQWYTIAHTASGSHRLSIAGYMSIMFFISWIELLFCLYIEEVRGVFGVPELWYYPFQKKYWLRKRVLQSIFIPEPHLPASETHHRKSHYSMSSSFFYDNRSETSIQAGVRNKVGVELINLTKMIGQRQIVSNLTLNLYENEITTLLGQPGSGKTTTILLLCGILKPTYGTAFINGFQIAKQAKQAKSCLGICLKQSAIFKGMSVKDHLYFFSRIKGYGKDEAELESEIYITNLKLAEFRNIDAKNLSVSNQRCLSLACALCGGSKVVLCDEPTTGLDTTARHDLWRLLQKEKQGRTILFTTQHMEESEIIGDRIAVINDGELRSYGTLGFLKYMHNTSYTLSCEMTQNVSHCELTELITRFVSSAKPVVRGHDVNYKLPRDETHKFSEMFRELESNKKILGVRSFGLTDSSLEEIFIAKEIIPRLRGGTVPEDNEKADFSVQTDSSKLKGQRPKYQEQEPEPKSIIKKENSETLLPPPPKTRTPKIAPQEVWTPEERKKPTVSAQFRAMLIKKAFYTVSKLPIFLIILIIPIIFIIIALISDPYSKDLRANDLQTVLPLSLEYYNYEDIIILLDVDNKLGTKYAEAYKKLIKAPATIQKVDSVFSYLFRATPLIRRDINRKYVCGVSFKDSSAITVWYNSKAFAHSAPIAMNLVYNALGKVKLGNHFEIIVNRGQLDHFTERNKNSIKVRKKRQDDPDDPDYSDYEDFETQPNDDYVLLPQLITPIPGHPHVESGNNDVKLAPEMSLAEASSTFFNDKAVRKRFLGLIILITAYIALALSIFSLLVTQERVHKMKVYQEIQGLKPFYYWLTHFLYDLAVFFIFMVALTFAILRVTFWHQSLIILILFGVACLPFVYLCTLMFSKPASAFVWIFIILLITGGLLFSIWLSFNVMVVGGVRAIFVIFPMYVGTSGLLKCMSTPEYCSREVLPPIDDIDCWFGTNNVFCSCKPINNWVEPWLLLIHGFIWFFFLSISDYSVEIVNFLHPKESNRNYELSDKHKKVLDEERRVGQISKLDYDEYPLIVDQIYKQFCCNQAVQLVSFLVKPGECFGLLGPKGSGKTSIYRMIVGDTSMTGGNIYVNGISVRDNRVAAKKIIGYCSQNDTLHDFLTGRQVLTIYCLLRGVPKEEIRFFTELIATNFAFRDLLDQKIETYSGGTRRKLCLALAVSEGTLICLDEANNSVDSDTRNFLSQKLGHVNNSGRAIVVTTNDLEEASVLCTRVGVLFSGELKYLGSLQHVRSEISNIIVLKVKINLKSNNQKEEVKRFRADMKELFPSATLMESIENNLRYHLSNQVFKLSSLFYQMERKRNEDALEDYSISQVSLDELFMILNNEEERAVIDFNSSNSDDEENVEFEIKVTSPEKQERKNIKKEAKLKEKRKKDRQKRKEQAKNKRPATTSESSDSDEFIPDKGKNARK